MFARRFYPGRFFAPRYWPGPGQGASALPPAILSLSLGLQPQEAITMNCATRNDLRLERHNQAELPLSHDNTDQIPLRTDTSVPVAMQYQTNITLALEDGNAP